ncbi:MAG: ROK family protein [Planctomycetes bacterium]|nr:ROK family protein [Planctomycetota bacterium]
MPMPTSTRQTLAIDIGGSGVKASVLDEHGKMLHERVRIDSPVGAHPDEFVAAIAELVADLPAAPQVAVGFPGMVRDGVVSTAPNLGHDAWRGYDLAKQLGERLGRPVRVANDADVQGFAVIQGKGLEMVVTLGTGFGTALYQDGKLCPHLEISHQPFRKGESYDEQVGNAARKKIGNKHWQKRVLEAIDNMRELTHFDRIYLGGGNAKKLDGELPADVTVVDNDAGIAGGAALWRD